MFHVILQINYRTKQQLGCWCLAQTTFNKPIPFQNMNNKSEEFFRWLQSWQEKISDNTDITYNAEILSVIHFTLCPVEMCGLWMVPKGHTDAFFVSHFLMMAQVKLPPCVSWRHIGGEDEQLHSILTSALRWSFDCQSKHDFFILIFQICKLLQFSRDTYNVDRSRDVTQACGLCTMYMIPQMSFISVWTHNLPRSVYLSIQSFQ